MKVKRILMFSTLCFLFCILVLVIYQYLVINSKKTGIKIEKLVFDIGNIESFDIPYDEFIISQVSKELNTTSIPVLAYHDFMTKEDKNRYAPDPSGKYTMYIDELDRQLKYLYDNGYRTIDYKTLNKWLLGEIYLDNKNFMITIDDANISSYYLAIPVIEKYGFTAIIFVITGRVKEISNQYDASNISFLGNDLIKDIRQNHTNIYLGSHSTYLHGLIDGKNPKDVLTYEELLNDLINSKEFLNTEIFAYPFGMYNDKYLKAVNDAGFSLAFIFKPSGRVKLGTDRLKIPRININSEVSFSEFKRLVETEW